MSTYSSHTNISSGAKVPCVVLTAHSLQLWYHLKAALSILETLLREKKFTKHHSRCSIHVIYYLFLKTT